jgi:putative Ca2+/H+ antiporter (TMEM165/GDT1 family)
VFTAVFIAGLGDKTQLATFLFAADKEVNKYTIFSWGMPGLVLARGLVSEYVGEKYLNYAAGTGFILIGL